MERGPVPLIEVIIIIHRDLSLAALARAELEKRLRCRARGRCHFLASWDSRHVVHRLLAPVMQSMQHCSRARGDLTERETHELIWMSS